MVEFAELVWYHPLRSDVGEQRQAKANMEPRFLNGIFLGLTDRSDEVVVFGPHGIRKARTLRRKSEPERWNAEQLLSVRRTPLQPNPGENDTRLRTNNHNNHN